MILWYVAVFLAYFVKGLCGFANTLIFSSIMSFQTANVAITPIDLVLGYPANLIMAFKGRKKIDWKLCAMLSAMVMAGCIPGAIFLKGVDTTSVKRFFGFVIIFVALQMFFSDRRGDKKEMSKPVLFLIGIGSGILCGLYGIGALLASYMSKVSKDSETFKTNMSAVFFVENSFRVILYLFTGILTAANLKQALFLFPCVLLGLAAGMGSSRLLDEKFIRKLVILLLIFSGVTTLIS